MNGNKMFGIKIKVGWIGRMCRINSGILPSFNLQQKPFSSEKFVPKFVKSIFNLIRKNALQSSNFNLIANQSQNQNQRLLSSGNKCDLWSVNAS